MWLLAFLAPWLCVAEDFVAGADGSHVRFFEDRGVVYGDGGSPRDPLELLRERGLNCVRLRLFTSSADQAAADPYNAINNLDYTLPLAVRVKRAGLKFLLDFHYSDTWADPGKQTKPAAWADLPFEELEQRIYEHTRTAILAFRDAGAAPEIVQVGNEITAGLLWPDGRVGGGYDTALQWNQLGRLLKSAVRAVREASDGEPPRIMIHIDRGGDWEATRWFFDRLLLEEVDFDLIGLSYYPFWHGPIASLRTCLNRSSQRYGRPVMVVETAFPWSGTTNIVGIPPTPDGQVDYVVELARVVRAVPEGRGAGIIWWGSEYVRIPGESLAGFDRRSFFDFEGRVLPAPGVLGQMTAPIRIQAERAPGFVRLNWPLSGVGLALQSTSNPAGAAGWSPVDLVPEWEGTAWTATVPGTNSVELFRLSGD